MWAAPASPDAYRATQVAPPPIKANGVQPPVPVSVHNYEIVLEVENDDEFASVMSVILPAGTTSMEVPASFLALGDDFKYEVLVREENFNQTATESCFVLD